MRILAIRFLNKPEGDGGEDALRDRFGEGYVASLQPPICRTERVTSAIATDFKLRCGGYARGLEHAIRAQSGLVANETADAVTAPCNHPIYQRGRAGQVVGQSSHSLRPGQHPQHFSGGGTRRPTTAILSDNVNRAKTIPRIDVG